MKNFLRRRHRQTVALPRNVEDDSLHSVHRRRNAPVVVCVDSEAVWQATRAAAIR
jgi:hypothetical protein